MSTRFWGTRSLPRSRRSSGTTPTNLPLSPRRSLPPRPTRCRSVTDLVAVQRRDCSKKGRIPAGIRAFLLTRLRHPILVGRWREPRLGGQDRGSGEMNKQELIGTVAETTGLNRGDASRAVEGVFDAITSALKRGDEVRLVGFGTFSCSKRKASTGRNPRTGEPMQIKESTQPKFKAGKVLKDSVGIRG